MTIRPSSSRCKRPSQASLNPLALARTHNNNQKRARPRTSVELELELFFIAPAGSAVALDGNYLPILLREHRFQIAIEQLAVGRRDFQPERVVAIPHDFARDLPRRTGNQPGQQIPLAVPDGP